MLLVSVIAVTCLSLAVSVNRRPGAYLMGGQSVLRNKESNSNVVGP